MTVAVQALTDEQIDQLIEKAGGRDAVLRVISGELALRLEAPASIGSALSVPAGLAFEDRVARGDYGWRNPDLTEQRFPVTDAQVGEKALEIFHFRRSLSSEDAIREIRAAGFEPAETGDILAFGEAFPEAQRRHPVVGLGSVVEIDGKLSVPVLWFDGEERTLDLIWYDGDWHRNYRFLGVRRGAG
ncbi:hypothetical protein [Sphingomonas sp.]|uniref:hypothetical protein n=1 Tax=Sphingomonas sp. TaxID=28214 RepID=UPI001B04A190|nr:hypothetical protein [Sphingomonas sp.]MBO9714595.1 hypothetical protein [Sphingomonas sp.]